MDFSSVQDLPGLIGQIIAETEHKSETAIARAIGCPQSSIHRIRSGAYKNPAYTTVMGLLQLLEENKVNQQNESQHEW